MTSEHWNYTNPQRRERLVNVAELRRLPAALDPTLSETIAPSLDGADEMSVEDEGAAGAT